MRHENALQLLRRDHRELQRIFHELERAEGREQDRLCDEMVQALRTHTRIEEEVFYPYVREATDALELVEEASIEHNSAKQLLQDLDSGSNEIHRHAVIKVLGDYVGHHIREEEDRIFPIVEKTGVDLDALGEELLAHKDGRAGHGAMAGGEPQARGREAKSGDGEAGRAAKASARERHEPSAQEDREFVDEHRDELSRSTQHAQWIHSPDEREQHPGQTLATRSADVIKAWAEERKAVPATSPGGNAEEPRVLRFDFPDYDKGLQQVAWDAWLGTFEERELVFLFQQHKKNGKQSNFFRLDSPNREEG